MQLDSYLELFTTMYGWAFANIIGELITGTGLVILPFAIIIFQGWREAKEQGADSGGVLAVIDSVQTKLIIALFVLSVCFATTPITSLVNAHLEYTPQASAIDPSPETGTLTSGAGTYNPVMSDAADGSMSDVGNLANVPLWWYTVMSVSSGINNAFRNGLRNSGSDIRVVEDMARMATIEDPKVHQVAQDFYNQCFLPARSRYLRMDRSAISPAGLAIIDPGNADEGPSDVDWMGSHFFREEPGFYGAMRAANPVPGFVVDFSRDTDYYDPASGMEPPRPGVINPEWGRPTCKEWWEAGETGVRDALVGHSSMIQKGMDLASHIFSWPRGHDELKDSWAQLAAVKANPTFMDSDGIMGPRDMNVGQRITSALSTIGVGFAALTSSAVMTPLTTSLPMMQALVLMAIYMFLPLIVFLSGFDLKAMFYGAVAIFTVKLWATMWTVANWMDGHLIAAMYPGLQGNVILQEATHLASGTVPQGYKRMILNILMVMMFIGLPIIWTGMMGWIGVRMGGQIDSIARTTENQSKTSASSSTGLATKGKVR